MLRKIPIIERPSRSRTINFSVKKLRIKSYSKLSERRKSENMKKRTHYQELRANWQFQVNMVPSLILNNKQIKLQENSVNGSNHLK